MQSSSKTWLYRNIPKVELHRHLEGSLRYETILEVVRKHGITLPLRNDLRGLVQMQEDEHFSFDTFLAKFKVLRLLYRSPEIIRRITREAVADAAADNIRHMELRFTPVALTRSENFPLADVMDWVCESARDASQQYGLSVRLIASINRHEPLDLGAEVVRLAAQRLSRGIVGIDLAGDEANHSAAPFVKLFQEARAAGLALCVHAGEWGGAENVRAAIQEFKADRIGHGVRVVEDAQVLALARETGIPFEVCMTSNYHSGVSPSIKEHPLGRMLAVGLNVTINTDDPSISRITLGGEYRLFCDELGLPWRLLVDRILTAARVAFLTPTEKEKLHSLLNHEFKRIFTIVSPE